MTKYKLLKPIKNVEWNVGEVRETEEGHGGDSYLKINNFALSHFTLALLEHAGFIEDVDETPKRWRAARGGVYYCLGRDFEVAEVKDYHNGFDNDLYEACNYFQTTEQAEEFRKGVKALVGIK